MYKHILIRNNYIITKSLERLYYCFYIKISLKN